MGSNLTDYLSLFASFTNPFAIVLSATYWTIGTFLFFLLLIIFLRKFILVKRKNKFLKILSWSWLFIIPIVAIFFGFKFGILNGIRCDLKNHASNYTKGLDLVMKKSLGTTADGFFVELGTGNKAIEPGLTTNEFIERFSDTITVKFQHSIETLAAEKDDLGGKTAGLFLYIIKRKGVAMGIKYAVRELLYRELGGNKTTSRNLMQIKFRELLQKGIFTTILKTEIDSLFIPWQKGTALLFLFILLIPAAEIVIANILFRKEKQAVSRSKFQS